MDSGAITIGECCAGNVSAMRVVCSTHHSKIFIKLLSGQRAVGNKLFKGDQCFGWQCVDDGDRSTITFGVEAAVFQHGPTQATGVSHHHADSWLPGKLAMAQVGSRVVNPHLHPGATQSACISEVSADCSQPPVTLELFTAPTGRIVQSALFNIARGFNRHGRQAAEYTEGESISLE